MGRQSLAGPVVLFDSLRRAVWRGGPVLVSFCVFNILTLVAAKEIEAKGLIGRFWNLGLEVLLMD